MFKLPGICLSLLLLLPVAGLIPLEIRGEEPSLLEDLQSPVIFEGDLVTAYRDPGQGSESSKKIILQ